MARGLNSLMETIFALYHKPSSYSARQGISGKTEQGKNHIALYFVNFFSKHSKVLRKCNHRISIIQN